MSIVIYDPNKPRFADGSHFHPLVDPAAYFATGAPAYSNKCNEGSYVDPTHAAAQKATLAAGKVYMPYGFSHGGDSDTFLREAPPANLVLPVLDAEASDLTLSEAETWVDKVAAAYGREPVVYAHSWAMGKNIAGSRLSKCPSWQATYGNDLSVIDGFASLLGWQFTNGVIGPPASPRSIAGVSGNCDISMLVITEAELRALAGAGQEDDLPYSKDELTGYAQDGAAAAIAKALPSGDDGGAFVQALWPLVFQVDDAGNLLLDSHGKPIPISKLSKGKDAALAKAVAPAINKANGA